MGTGISGIREDIALLTFKCIIDFENKSPNVELINEMNLLDSRINSIDVDDERILTYRVCIPKSKTEEMANGLNSGFYTQAKNVFAELNSGGTAIDGKGFWRGFPDEPMLFVDGDINISKWRDCINLFGDFLKQMQIKLQQQSVYLTIGNEAKELDFWGKSTTSYFPEQDKFSTIDPEFSKTLESEITEYTITPSPPPPAPIGEKPLEGLNLVNNNSKEKIRLAKNFIKLEKKLREITFAQSKWYQQIANDDTLLNEITTFQPNSSPIELLMKNENGGLLFTSMFNQELDFNEDSLELIRCKLQDGRFYPEENQDFFSDIRLAYKIVSDKKIESNTDIQEFVSDQNKSVFDLVNADSLIHCVIDSERDLPTNHPAIWYKIAQKQYEDNVKGKGTQIDALRNRFQKLTWGMDFYVREESEVREFYTDFLNYPMLAISGIGGVGKTALMMKLVWDSIQEKPDRFNHYLILTSKGKDQGTLELLPGKAMISNNFSKSYTIAKYFESYASFIKRIAVLNRYIDHENKEYSLDTLTNYAIDVLKYDKVLLVIDNFEDFEDGNHDFPQFVKFFDRFKKLLRPESRIIITTRGDGMIAKNPKKLLALKPSDTAVLFVKRLSWLVQKGHYSNIHPKNSVDLITKINEILTRYSPNEDVIKRIGHPASVLLLAASIKDDANENPVTYFESEIKDLKNNKYISNREDFFKYCVTKSLEAQQEAYPKLPELVQRLAHHQIVDEITIEDELLKIDGSELSSEQRKNIIDILVRYSFLEKTNSALNDNSYVWNNTAKAFISGMSTNDEIKRELSVDGSKVNLTYINKLNSLIDLFEGRRATIKGGRGGRRSNSWGLKSTDIAMSTQYSKISNNLNDAFKKILRLATQQDLDLAVRVFQSSHNFLDEITKSETWSEDVIEDLVRNAVKFIEMFSNRWIEEFDKDETILDNNHCNSLLKSATMLWEFSVGSEKDEKLSNLPWVPKFVEEVRNLVVKICIDLTNVDFDINSEGTDAGITILQNIYSYHQFDSSRWRNEASFKVKKTQLSANIQLLESWYKIYDNLDRHCPEDLGPFLKEYATVCVNLASIHPDLSFRLDYLKKAEKFSSRLPPRLQNTVSRLKDYHETGWFEVNELAKLYLKFDEQIPIGTTIALDRNPEMLGTSSIYTLKVTSKFVKIEKEFRLNFAEAVQCNNSPYLVDILSQTAKTVFTVKARRKQDGELKPVPRLKDGAMNKNWLVLEDQILDWVNNLIKKNDGPVDRFDIETEAENYLISQVNFKSLQELKNHLLFVHPKLSRMSTNVNFAIMIVKIAEGNEEYQFFIDNDSNLANKIRPVGKSQSDALTQEPVEGNPQLYSRNGFGLPPDRLVLATLLISFHERLSHLTDDRIRYVLNIWKKIGEQNSLSRGKAKRLFQFICLENKYSPKLHDWLDFTWQGCNTVLDLSNRMEKNMKKHNRELASDGLRSYFEEVHQIIARSRI